MAWTRRQLLFTGAAGLLGVAALGGGAGALALRGGVYRAPPRAPVMLSPVEYGILAAVADRIVRGEGLDAEALEVALRVDGILARMHPAAVDEVRTVLHLLENALAGLVLEGRATPFTACSPDQQDAILRGWSRASIPLFRTAYLGLHGLCMGAAWSRHDLYAHAGYPGPPALHGLLDAAREVPTPPGDPTGDARPDGAAEGPRPAQEAP